MTDTKPHPGFTALVPPEGAQADGSPPRILMLFPSKHARDVFLGRNMHLSRATCGLYSQHLQVRMGATTVDLKVCAERRDLELLRGVFYDLVIDQGISLAGFNSDLLVRDYINANLLKRG